jgi:hypothetical protein
MGPSPRDQYAVPVVLREPPRRRRSLRLLRRRACDHAARLHRAEIAGEAMPLRYGNDRRCCERRGWRRGTESSQTHRWREMDSNLRSPTDPLPYPSNQLAPDDGWPIAVSQPGTESSNPSPSSRESAANLTSEGVAGQHNAMIAAPYHTTWSTPRRSGPARPTGFPGCAAGRH